MRCYFILYETVGLGCQRIAETVPPWVGRPVPLHPQQSGPHLEFTVYLKYACARAERQSARTIAEGSDAYIVVALPHIALAHIRRELIFHGQVPPSRTVDALHHFPEPYAVWSRVLDTVDPYIQVNHLMDEYIVKVILRHIETTAYAYVAVEGRPACCRHSAQENKRAGLGSRITDAERHTRKTPPEVTGVELIEFPMQICI